MEAELTGSYGLQHHVPTSCAKSLAVHYGGQILRLLQSREVTVDGEEVARMPYSIRHSGILVMESSSLWITGDAGHGGEYISCIRFM